MDFNLTSEQRLIQDATRRMSEREIVAAGSTDDVERSRAEALRKVRSYTPGAELVVVVSVPCAVFSTILQPFDDIC